MKLKKQPKKQRPQTKKSGPTLETKKSGLTLDTKDLQGRLRFIGGSASDHWNSILVNQATDSLWVAHSEEEGQDRRRSATVVALASIRPKDELEGMIAAQLLAAHNATMECYRRAMLPQQSSEGRSENLNQANKLSRAYSVLLDALNGHRGKGQQIRGARPRAFRWPSCRWHGRGPGGRERNWRNNPMQSKSPMHLSRRCGAWTRRESRCQSPAMPNGRCELPRRNP
jgi:hypothetical protein